MQRKMMRRGFTLMELLLVMVILAVLAVLVVPRFVGRAEDVKKKAAAADISNIKSALNLFEQDNGRFPTNEEGLAALLSAPGGLKDWKGPYIERMPVDPWGNAYNYSSPGAHVKVFDLYSFGPDGREGGGDDIDNWSDLTAK